MTFNLLEIKHKLKTQDIWRAATVRFLVGQIDAKDAEIQKLRDEVERLKQPALFAPAEEV